MNLRALLALAALTSASLTTCLVSAEALTSIGRPYDSTHILAGERMLAGPERGVPLIKTATVDTISVPVTIAHQVRDETRAYGPLGVVSGAIRGGMKGGAQLLGGLLKGTIGVLDVASEPVGGIED